MRKKAEAPALQVRPDQMIAPWNGGSGASIGVEMWLDGRGDSS
jgi:hypothetical protein